MNIFYLHSDPTKCAQFHNDKHVVKMILETAQLLCGCHWAIGSHAPYKLSHKNHPCSIWVRQDLNNYSIFQQKNIIYCYKGLIGRIAPIIVHFSMILTLIGAIIGSLGGFKAQEIIPKTETFHIQNVLNNGQFTFIPKVSLRINDFWITYTKQTTITQFYSDLSILNVDGNEVERKTIFVNSPAKYNGIDYYQTDWNILGLRIKNNDSSIFQYPFITLPNSKEKIWLSWISNNPQLNDGLTILIDNLQGYCSVYNKSGNFLGNLELNESLKIENPITLMDILSSTGLQIKSDPGILLIYSGFLFLMVSTLISYITYSQIWIVEDKKKIFIGGNCYHKKRSSSTISLLKFTLVG